MTYLHIRCISRKFGLSNFVYEGHQAEVKVTGAKKSNIPIPAM